MSIHFLVTTQRLYISLHRKESIVGIYRGDKPSSPLKQRSDKLYDTYCAVVDHDKKFQGFVCLGKFLLNYNFQDVHPLKRQEIINRTIRERLNHNKYKMYGNYLIQERGLQISECLKRLHQQRIQRRNKRQVEMYYAT